MGTLTIKDLKKVIEALEEQYGEKALDFKVALGDDEELNGVHEAFFAQIINKNVKNYDIFKMIDCGDILEENTFLIS